MQLMSKDAATATSAKRADSYLPPHLYADSQQLWTRSANRYFTLLCYSWFKGPMIGSIKILIHPFSLLCCLLIHVFACMCYLCFPSSPPPLPRRRLLLLATGACGGGQVLGSSKAPEDFMNKDEFMGAARWCGG